MHPTIGRAIVAFHSKASSVSIDQIQIHKDSRFQRMNRHQTALIAVRLLPQTPIRMHCCIF